MFRSAASSVNHHLLDTTTYYHPVTWTPQFLLTRKCDYTTQIQSERSLPHWPPFSALLPPSIIWNALMFEIQSQQRSESRFNCRRSLALCWAIALYLKRYSPACTRLLSQYKTMLKLVGSDVPSVEEFMKRYHVCGCLLNIATYSSSTLL